MLPVLIGIAALRGLCLASVLFLSPAAMDTPAPYHVELVSGHVADLRQRFTPSQIDTLEKLNRADRAGLSRFRRIVVPDCWLDDELGYSPLPRAYAAAAGQPKFLVVEQSHQVFGAYEFGALVRWGPVSSGRESNQTPDGLFHLTWRSRGRHSTVNPDWFMPWYFNFENALGLSLHRYSLPGGPASHSCIRLLERDAVWLFHWGAEWTLDASQRTVVEPGTPLLIVGKYDFGSPPPWRTLDSATMSIQLP
jgi:hypothetical protein